MKKNLLLLLCLPLVLFAQTDSSSSTNKKEILFKDVIINSTGAKEKDPTVFQNITKNDLQKNNLGQDMPYLLDNTPSLVTTSDAGAGVGYTGMRIRGTDATRINITLNDVPVNDAESQGMYWVNLPDLGSSLQRIQIQRGIGKSTNGAGAFGASVNMQSPAYSQKWFVEFNNSYGSFQTLKHTLNVGTGLLKNVFFADAGVSKISSNGYVERASSDLYSYHAQLGFVFKRAVVRLLYFGGQEKTYQSWNGVSEDSLVIHRRQNSAGTDYFYKTGNPYYNQIDNYRQDYLQLIASNTFKQTEKINLYGKVTLFSTFGKGYYEEYKVGQYLDNYGLPTAGIYSDLIRRKWLDNIFFGGVYSLHGEHSNGFNWVLGGMISQYRGDHFGKLFWIKSPVAFSKKDNYYFNKGIKNDENVYANLNYFLKTKGNEQQADGINFMLDLQYRYISHYIAGTEDIGPLSKQIAYHFFNPKAGISFIKQTSQNFPFKLYASYAYANHEPSRDDLINAKDAKPEKMHDVEIGFQETNNRFPFSVNYYLMYYQNQLVLSGKLNDVGNAIRINVPESFRTGIELNGRFNFNAARKNTSRTIFSINYNLTLSMNKIKAFEESIPVYDENYTAIDSATIIIKHKNTDISFSPNIIGFLELSVFPIKNFEIALNNKFISRQYLDNSQERERSLKPYFYNNIRLSYLLSTSLAKEIRFTVLLNNILNRLYESNGYTYGESYLLSDGNKSSPTHYNYYYPQAGFNFSVGLNLKF